MAFGIAFVSGFLTVVAMLVIAAFWGLVAKNFWAAELGEIGKPVPA